MKKMIVTLAISISFLTAFAGEENVSPQVLDAFKEEFTTAEKVEWTVGKNYYKAAFIYNEKHFFAWYSFEGEMIALSRYISPADMPAKLQSNLKKNYSDYWISDLFEVTKHDGTSFFVTLENADYKIVLRSSGLGWSVYQKIKKV
jgi:hypothetical protein